MIKLRRRERRAQPEALRLLLHEWQIREGNVVGRVLLNELCDTPSFAVVVRNDSCTAQRKVTSAILGFR